MLSASEVETHRRRSNGWISLSTDSLCLEEATESSQAAGWGPAARPGGSSARMQHPFCVVLFCFALLCFSLHFLRYRHHFVFCTPRTLLVALVRDTGSPALRKQPSGPKSGGLVRYPFTHPLPARILKTIFESALRALTWKESQALGPKAPGLRRVNTAPLNRDFFQFSSI